MTTPIVPEAILSQHVVVLGKTRSGKSSVMRGLVERLLHQERPVCIVDPKGDWYGIKLARDGKRPGFPVVIFGGEHADVPITEHAGAAVAELFSTGNRPCLIDLGGWMPGARTRFWIDFASTLFRHTKGDRWLVVDEVHNFAPKGKTLDVDAGKALHWANRLASEGLGKGLQLLVASQRPQKVHNDTLTSCETLIAMRVLHPSDRAAVSDWIKGCGDAEGSEVLKSLAQMARGEAWVWSPEIGFGPVRIQFPMFETYDSFRPQSVEDTKKLKGWAEVDLEAVRTQFAATIEQAKRDDPKELRRQLAEKDRELTRLSALAPRANLNSQLDAKTVEVLTDTDRERLTALRDDLAAFRADVDAILARSIETMRSAVESVLSSAIDQVTSQHAHKSTIVASRLEKAGFQRILDKLDRVTGVSVAFAEDSVALRFVNRMAPGVGQARPIPPARAGTNGDLSGPEHRILNAIAWLESIGVGEPEQPAVAFLAGYTYGGGAFNNPRGALRTKGLVDYRGDRIVLTDSGRTHAEFPADALTTDELHARVLGRLPGPEQRILQPLLKAYPHAIDHDELARQAGYTPRAGAFNNPRGRLRSLGLIEYPQPGQARARALLFLEP